MIGAEIVLVGIWAYLVWMVWKKKTELAEKNLKRLKIFLLVAVISLAVGAVGIIGHNMVSAQIGEEELVFFTIGIVGLFVFFVATAGGLVTLIKGRRKTT